MYWHMNLLAQKTSKPCHYFFKKNAWPNRSLSFFSYEITFHSKWISPFISYGLQINFVIFSPSFCFVKKSWPSHFFIKKSFSPYSWKVLTPSHRYTRHMARYFLLPLPWPRNFQHGMIATISHRRTIRCKSMISNNDRGWRIYDGDPPS